MKFFCALNVNQNITLSTGTYQISLEDFVAQRPTMFNSFGEMMNNMYTFVENFYFCEAEINDKDAVKIINNAILGASGYFVKCNINIIRLIQAQDLIRK